jgi:hypothetical protein
MLNVATSGSPGLSAAPDHRAWAGGQLHSAAYARWVDRVAHLAAALDREAVTRAPRTRTLWRSRIGIPSPASGTLSRLP